VNGIAAIPAYAERAPGRPGVDQINVPLPVGVTSVFWFSTVFSLLLSAVSQLDEDVTDAQTGGLIQKTRIPPLALCFQRLSLLWTV
jgi:hypothetical protein